jgi:hypothetical protein
MVVPYILPDQHYIHQLSEPMASALSFSAGSGNSANELEVKNALIEVAVPIEGSLAGSAREPACSSQQLPITGTMVLIWARWTGYIVTDDGERIAIGCGQRLVVVIRDSPGAGRGTRCEHNVALICTAPQMGSEACPVEERGPIAPKYHRARIGSLKRDLVGTGSIYRGRSQANDPRGDEHRRYKQPPQPDSLAIECFHYLFAPFTRNGLKNAFGGKPETDGGGLPAPASGGWPGQAGRELSGAFLHFDNLISEEAVRLAMDCRGRLFARSLRQTKDFAGAFIEPVFQVFHAMFGLGLKVLGMGAGNCFGGQAGYVLVNIQIEWHIKFLLSGIDVLSQISVGNFLKLRSPQELAFSLRNLRRKVVRENSTNARRTPLQFSQATSYKFRKLAACATSYNLPRGAERSFKKEIAAR